MAICHKVKCIISLKILFSTPGQRTDIQTKYIGILTKEGSTKNCKFYDPLGMGSLLGRGI